MSLSVSSFKRQSNAGNNSRFVLCSLAGMTLLGLALISRNRIIFRYSTSSSTLRSTNTSIMVEALSTTTANNKQHRILAFGDSLTAGTSGYQSYPYAPHLEAALNSIRSAEGNNSVVVRHRGMPGWTAENMLNDLDGQFTGLRSAIQAVKDPSLSLVIILVGTNDIGRGYDEETITKNILELHHVCYDNGIPKTIAISIPPSGYQSQNKDAADLANRISSNLKDFCLTNQEKATFFQFPFPFERNGENWYMDTLHFSQKGYQVLGESLAPTVNTILNSLDEQAFRR